METPGTGFDQFLPTSDPEYTLAVINRTASDPFQTMIENVFADQPITVTEQLDPAKPNNTIALFEDRSLVAESPLEALADAILMVNSDLYMTGTRDIDRTETPDVLEHLTDVSFTVRGYPHSHSEKLLLILISRYIEQVAYSNGSGTLRTGFQQLSRIRDEVGTMEVYRKLAATAVDVHLYGVPDRLPTDEVGATLHHGDTPAFEKTWFVVYRPDSNTGKAAALLALEKDANTYQGFWTYDESQIEAIARYIRQNL